MDENQIRDKLNQAIENAVPDVLDNILIQCDQVKGAELHMNNNINKEKSLKRVYAVVGAIAAVAALVIGIAGYNNQLQMKKVQTVVAFDVNPSLEIEVNKEEKVIDVKALNEDAEIILADMDFEDVDLDIAVNAIIGSMLQNGYLTVSENSILVSVKSLDEETANRLQEGISKKVEEILKGNQIDASVLSQQYEDDKVIQKFAEDNKISLAKAKLISRIMEKGITDSKGNAYTSETLAKLTVNELNLLLSSKNVTLDNVQSSGAASEESYIGKEKAKELAFADATVTSDAVTEVEVELDCDDGVLVYEVEFETAEGEYEYEIDAKDGTIIKREIKEKSVENTPVGGGDVVVDDDDDDDDDDMYDDDDDDDDDMYDDDDDDMYDDDDDDMYDDDDDDMYDDDDDDDMYDDDDDDDDDMYDDDDDDDMYDDDDDDIYDDDDDEDDDEDDIYDEEDEDDEHEDDVHVGGNVGNDGSHDDDDDEHDDDDDDEDDDEDDDDDEHDDDDEEEDEEDD